jgi:coat protein Gp5
MADNVFIKAEKVVRTILGMLEREITLPALVWRDAGGSFKGVANDTITLRIPAYVTNRTRVLRGGRPITLDSLTETSVNITLDTDVYKAVAITDEEMTLDIEDFGAQVLQPIVHSVARGVEDSLVTTIEAAPYNTTIAIDEADPYPAFVDARMALNNAFVPVGGRFLALGSNVESALLKSDRLSKFDQSGSDTALREATIGRIAGFTAVSYSALDPDVAIAAHQTAFVLSMQAPMVPDGVTWGESQSFAGISMRVIKDYDFMNVQDRLLADVFVGSNTVLDRGTFDDDGHFVPSEDGSDTPIFTRAVELTLGGS